MDCCMGEFFTIRIDGNRKIFNGDAYKGSCPSLGVTWSCRRAFLLDLLGVLPSSLSNLTSLGVHPSNSSKQPFRQVRFDGKHCNPEACLVVHDNSWKSSAIVVCHHAHIKLQITRFHFPYMESTK